VTETTRTGERHPGVDHRPNGYRVRMTFGERRYVRAGIPSFREAKRLALHWEDLRDAGEVPPEAETLPHRITFGLLAGEVLHETTTKTSRQTKRKRRASTVHAKTKALKPWSTGPRAKVAVHLFRYEAMRRWYAERSTEAPAAANGELAALKALLRHAREHYGAAIDARILDFKGDPTEERPLVALSVAELEFLAMSAPPAYVRLVLVLGTTGLRIGEALTLTDDRVHLGRYEVHIPAELCKEGDGKDVALTDEEVVLFREHLGGRLHVVTPSATGHLPSRTPNAAGLVFPAPRGGFLHYPKFHQNVWTPAVRAAAARWDAQHGAEDNPFRRPEGLKPHDLRATAATLMREAGLSREDAAARLGHHDSGELLDRIYDRSDKAARSKLALHAAAKAGLRAGGRDASAETPEHRSDAGKVGS
jgi:integrase